MNALTLYCPNPFCKQANDAGALFCGACQTVLPRRYLWAVGADLQGVAIGELVDDRYVMQPEQVLLDCYPGLLPEMPKDITLILEAYLKLSTFAPQMPKVYSVPEWAGKEVILLEEGAIFGAVLDVNAGSQAGQVMPKLMEMWKGASDFRRLSWVYQMVELWEPLLRFDGLETLFRSELIRVDADVVKVLAVDFSKTEGRSIPALLKMFMDYETADQSVIGLRLRDWCDRLIQEPEDEHSYLVCEWLDQELIHYTDGSLVVEICTLTDQGPNRNRNEDACFPSAKGIFSARFEGSQDIQPLVVVCDGIGGHEGGNVASELAISTLESVVNGNLKGRGTEDVVAVLKAGIRQANDAICERNDGEGRTERQRMGTTVVLGRVDGRRVHVAHVGDSRVYRITRSSCYQLTADDDVASREVRMGYTLYRDAVGRTGAGALTQALGMVTSSLLHPTVRSWFVDEDCIFLLCSDGLSDYDRVDECWVREILPVLEGRMSLASACQGLVEIANARNGHDNVTVGLIYCRVGEALVVAGKGRKRDGSRKFGKKSKTKSGGKSPGGTRQALSVRRSLRTVGGDTELVVVESRGGRWRWGLLFLLCAVLGVAAGFVGMRLMPGQVPELAVSSGPEVRESGLPKSGLSELKLGQLVKVRGDGIPGSGLMLLPNAGIPVGQTEDVPGATVGDVLLGTVMRVVDRRVVQPDGGIWVRFRVCKAGATGDRQVKVGVEGWHVERTVLERLEVFSGEDPEVAMGCPVK